MAASTSIHDKLRELYVELLAENNSEANKVSDSFFLSLIWLPFRIAEFTCLIPKISFTFLLEFW